MPFTHLHLHSEYSLLDGANKIGALVKRVKDLGMSACAITDHGVMFGAVEFYKTCQAAGIKPIIGCEVYISPTTRTERGPGAVSNHLVLLAQDFTGYLNLCRLVSIGYTEGFYRKPRIDHEVLAAHSDGLICLSACLKGEVAETLIKGSSSAARDRAGKYRDIFGRDRFFLEIQNHGIPEQAEVIRAYRKMSADLGLRVVASNDSHYLTRDSADGHDCLLCIGTGKLLSAKDRMRYYAPEFYVKSPAEMEALFREWPETVALTEEIASACASEIKFKQKLYPKYPLPEGETNAAAYMRRLVAAGLRERFGDALTPSLRERADFECGVIEKTGFVDYFLVVWDFIRQARTLGIPVGPGRGSGAGSIVAFALRITDVDPIEHGLLFERFLNPERVSAPDFDIDFCFERRGEVIDYVRAKYGRDNVANIITFGTLKPKAAIRDVGRVLEVPLGRVDQIAKMLPEGPAGPKDLTHALAEYPELKAEYDRDAQVKQLIDLARSIEGTSRHASVHAAGIVIADQPLSGILPIYKAPSTEERVVQYTMGTVEELGLLKMDFLGLKNLTIIDRCLRDVERAFGVTIDWDAIPLDDPETYALLRTGNTAGIFQLESPGMRDVVKKLQPTEFSEISAILALYRPGPLESGMIEDFVERKHGRQKVAYDHPVLEPILKETYGTIIYQEQVMQIPQTMAGYSLGGADLLRRAMGKKKKEAMDVERPKFVAGCVKQGYSEALATAIFDKMEKFAGYGFNKSHSVAYAMITFRTAYLKAHYPVAYNAAILTNEIDGGKATDRIPLYIMGCRDQGIAVLPPDVNASQAHFAVSGERGESIRFGLAAIKNVGRAAVDAIVVERDKGGRFTSLYDFCARVPSQHLNSRLVESLIRAGAFDSVHPNRAALLRVMVEALELGSAGQREAASGQVSMFSLMAGDGDANGAAAGGASSRDEHAMPEVPDWTAAERLAAEKELIGFYVSGHPLDRWRVDIESFSEVASSQLGTLQHGRRLRMVGTVTGLVHKHTQKGQPMAFVQMEDFTGAFEAIAFPRTFEKYGPMLRPDTVMVVTGKLDTAGRSPKILADEFHTPETMRRDMAKWLDLVVEARDVNNTKLTQLVQIVQRHKGALACRVAVRDAADTVVVAPGRGVALRIDPSDRAMADLAAAALRPRLRLALK